MISNPVLVEAAVKQIGPNVVCWSTHMLVKKPFVGKAIPWHQDAPYWNMFGDMHVELSF